MAGCPVRIEDNTTFPGEDNQEEYEALQQLSSGFKEQILNNRSLENLSKSSKMLVYPSYLDYLGGENPEKDDRFILKADGSDQYKSGNLVGFIGYGNEQLIIESRFGKLSFPYLLEKVFRIYIAKDFGFGTDSGLSILDILCFSFPIYLKSALAKGLYKVQT